MLVGTVIRRLFFKISTLRNFENFKGKTPVLGSLYNRLEDLQLY